MTTLFAQPYDITATGFYFDTMDQYLNRAAVAVNECGQRVEEFEIQFIDGETLDAELAEAWRLNQATVEAFLEATHFWTEDQKTRYIIAVGECGYSHDQVADDPDEIDITIYEVDTLRELAEQFVDDGLFGPIPESLANYIDYDAIARDLSFDYAMVEVGGKRLACCQ